jgi:hypothetical protein
MSPIICGSSNCRPSCDNMKKSQAAREGLDHVRFLLRLAELELIDRERRMVERRVPRRAFFGGEK